MLLRNEKLPFIFNVATAARNSLRLGGGTIGNGRGKDKDMSKDGLSASTGKKGTASCVKGDGAASDISPGEEYVRRMQQEFQINAKVIDAGIIAGPRSNACQFLSVMLAMSRIGIEGVDDALARQIEDDIMVVKATDAVSMQSYNRENPRQDALGTMANAVRSFICSEMMTPEGIAKNAGYFAHHQVEHPRNAEFDADGMAVTYGELEHTQDYLDHIQGVKMRSEFRVVAMHSSYSYEFIEFIGSGLLFNIIFYGMHRK